MWRSHLLHDISVAPVAKPAQLPSWAIQRRTVLSRWMDRGAERLQRLATHIIHLSDYFLGMQPRESLYRVPRLVCVHGKRPTVLDNCFIAPSAIVTGDVRVGRKNYIGYNTIIRAEENETVILGESCNVQEKAVVTGNTTVGKWTTIEPMTVIDSCDIGSCSFVGAGAVIMRGSRIETGSMLCAASVLQAGAVIPSGEMWAGNPAQFVKRLTEKEQEEMIKAAKHMVLIAVEHHDSWELTWDEIEEQRLARERYAGLTANNRELRVKAMYIKDPPRPNSKPMGRRTPKELYDGCRFKPPLREFDDGTIR